MRYDENERRFFTLEIFRDAGTSETFMGPAKDELTENRWLIF
jgi:hypothetical protein